MDITNEKLLLRLIIPNMAGHLFFISLTDWAVKKLTNQNGATPNRTEEDIELMEKGKK